MKYDPSMFSSEQTQNNTEKVHCILCNEHIPNPQNIHICNFRSENNNSISLKSILKIKSTNETPIR